VRVSLLGHLGRDGCRRRLEEEVGGHDPSRTFYATPPDVRNSWLRQQMTFLGNCSVVSAASVTSPDAGVPRPGVCGDVVPVVDYFERQRERNRRGLITPSSSTPSRVSWKSPSRYLTQHPSLFVHELSFDARGTGYRSIYGALIRLANSRRPQRPAEYPISAESLGCLREIRNTSKFFSRGGNENHRLREPVHKYRWRPRMSG